ncbi:MAG: RNA polymerase subunit sigma-70 [bacterium]|nr:RNA polymerase subunit sigma-70 [bacterium]
MAGERDWPEVYAELRALAERCMLRERDGHTLQPTALVHEAWLKLGKSEGLPETREGFQALAAVAMRHILVNHARDRGRLKRGGGGQRLSITDCEPAAATGQGVDIIALDEALTKLAERDARKARLVELRFFAGLGMEECAAEIEVSLATAKREWALARAFLLREMAAA